MAFFTDFVTPTYFAFVADKATMGWRGVFQVIVLSNKVKPYPVSDLFLYLASTKFESK